MGASLFSNSSGTLMFPLLLIVEISIAIPRIRVLKPAADKTVITAINCLPLMMRKIAITASGKFDARLERTPAT